MGKFWRCFWIVIGERLPANNPLIFLFCKLILRRHDRPYFLSIFFMLINYSLCIQGQNTSDFAKGRAPKSFNTSQPWIIMSKDDEDSSEEQSFLVVDREVLCELSMGPTLFLHALFMLLSVHYAFNFAFKKSQSMMFTFFEEFFLGITPKKKVSKISQSRLSSLCLLKELCHQHIGVQWFCNKMLCWVLGLISWEIMSPSPESVRANTKPNESFN